MILCTRRLQAAGARCKRISARSKKHVTCISTSQRGSKPRHIAVIGAGFGGLAVTYHLLEMGIKTGPISITLYDAYGIGAGASGAAAGILHPCSPKGKVTWRGEPAMAAAFELITVTELAAQKRGCELPICWRNGVIRVAKDPKQVESYRELGRSSSAPVECLSLAEASALVPGLIPPDVGGSAGAALWIGEGAVIHPQRYMEHLWHACEDLVESHPNGELDFRIEPIETLETLKGQQDVIVVAAGAATGAIKELRDAISMRLCQGYTLEMTDTQKIPSCQDSTPSLLGEPYIGFQGSRSMVLGATRQYEWTPENSFSEMGRGEISQNECPDSVSFLREAGVGIWRPLENWELVGVRSGVRALTSMTNTGAMPYAGKVHCESLPECWLATGLGARGVLYHAWLGKMLAEAIFAGDEGLLPPELRRWQQD